MSIVGDALVALETEEGFILDKKSSEPKRQCKIIRIISKMNHLQVALSLVFLSLSLR